jgi:anti-sigma regulatory factor (Ser/Thr protein kinase)
MNVIKIEIDFTKNRDNIKKLLDELVYDQNIDIYNIKIIFGDFVHSSLLAILASYILYLKKNKHVEIITKNEESKSFGYAQRMNFFKVINVNKPEYFQRWENQNNFIEITEFNEDSGLNVVENIINIFKNRISISYELDRGLNFSLYEILDNVIEHAEVENGIVIAQYFPNNHMINATIVDNGIGIRKSFQNSKYFPEMTEEQAIAKAIEERVSSKNEGKNKRGMGLNYTIDFVYGLLGEFSIYSGNTSYTTSIFKNSYSDINKWQGTIIDFSIDTNVEITENNYFNGKPPRNIYNEIDDLKEDDLW